jgi:enoyl-CoA hydratase/carnithine racemase
MAGTEKIAATIASRPRWAVRYALEALHAAFDLPLREGLRVESDLFGLCATTDDMKEGMRAFLEKRPPQFHGR